MVPEKPLKMNQFQPLTYMERAGAAAPPRCTNGGTAAINFQNLHRPDSALSLRRIQGALDCLETKRARSPLRALHSQT